MKRREFLKSATATGAGLLILPSGAYSGANSALNKLNIALIGVGGRGNAHMTPASKDNVVALCDVDEKQFRWPAGFFTKAKIYVDWRKCLDQKDLDAVVISTPDHTHAHITNWAINRGLHVYCEKPLGNSVHEARVVRANYLKNKNKIATQIGTQRHAFPNFARVRELIHDGAIGELKKVSCWGNRQLRKDAYLPAKGTPPKGFHYDLWVGPSPFHPYNPGYFEDNGSATCLNYNMYWDFGSGQVGDMGSHTMDLVWNVIDAGLPTSVEASGEAFNPDVTPVELESHFDHPANDWRPAIRVSWYQGGRMPESPRPYIDLTKIAHGAMFEGSKGVLISDFRTRILLPDGDDANMTYYQPRVEKELVPPIDHFFMEWSKACKGDLKTSCDADYSGTLIEQMHLGLVAYRVGKKIDYDGATGRVKNSAEANDLLKREYRQRWPLNG